jgi:MraZ protein
MFLGSTPLSLDAKGRLTVPTKHRDDLFLAGEKQVVLTASPYNYLILYTMPHWEKVQSQLAPLSNTNPAIAIVKRMVLGHAEKLELDGSGRLLVSPILRDHARLEKDVVMAGVGSNLEIWNAADWKAQQEAAKLIDLSLLPEGLEGVIV